MDKDGSEKYTTEAVLQNYNGNIVMLDSRKAESDIKQEADDAWKKAQMPLETIDTISPEDLAKRKHPIIVDVRKESEYEAEHVEDAYSRPLASINEWVKDINPEEHFFMHCAGGYRSMMAASILQARGYRNFSEV
jgi:rhodanese-related sulfurtransferase